MLTVSPNSNFEYESLEDKPAPLFCGVDNNGNAKNSSIAIIPEYQHVKLYSDTYPGNPNVIYKMEYHIEVPGNITGNSLIDILTDESFINLTQEIINSWKSEFDGSRYVGSISAEANETLQDFECWLMKFDADTSEIVDSDELMDSTIALDREGAIIKGFEFNDKEPESIPYSLKVLDTVIITKSSDFESTRNTLHNIININNDIIINDLDYFISCCMDSLSQG